MQPTENVFFVPLVVTVAGTKHMGPVTPQNLISIDTPNMLVVAERTPYLPGPLLGAQVFLSSKA